jgi:hypothetical protein
VRKPPSIEVCINAANVNRDPIHSQKRPTVTAPEYDSGKETYYNSIKRDL